MTLRHCTTRERYERIKDEGLRVSCADPAAKIKGVWMVTPSKTAYGVLHTQRKHGAALADVVVLTLRISPKLRKGLRKFRNTSTGYQAYYSVQDIPARAIKQVQPGADFAQSIAE